jgi:hypothetical protein
MSAAARRYAGNSRSGEYSGNQKKVEKTKSGNGGKIKIKKAGAKIKGFLSAVFMIMVIMTIFLFLTNRYFFKVKNISISTNDRYSYEEILYASGIEEGQELYGINVKQVKANIKERLTYADSVNIAQIPPSTLNIDIKTEKGLFGLMLGGDYYIISKSFRVIDKIRVVGNNSIKSEFKPPEGIITVDTDAIKKCYMGEKIQFLDGDILDCLRDITGLTEENGEMFSLINSIDVTNKFKVVMNYGDKFLIRFGIFENMSSKILNSFEIINQLPDYAEGVVDMTNDKVASFRYEENVAKLYKNGK